MVTPFRLGAVRAGQWLALSCVVACGAEPPGPAAPGGREDRIVLPGPEPPSSQPIRPAETEQAVPLIGGTLLVTADSAYAVAADPDRNRLFIVDLANVTLRHEVILEEGDEPGRLAEDAAGRVHVALRRGGALVTIDPTSGEILGRRSVCPAPRGVAYDSETDRILVACRTGELVWFAPEEGDAVRAVRLRVDLRDVVATPERLLVTTFRHAEVLVVDRQGTLQKVLRPNAVTGPEGVGLREPHVARRVGLLSDGSFFVQHQRSDQAPRFGGYGSSGGCEGPVSHNTVSVLPEGENVFHNRGVYPDGFIADFAISPDGRWAALVPGMGTTTVFVGDGAASGEVPQCERVPSSSMLEIPGQASAIAFDAAGRVLVQSREPAVLRVDETVVTLSSDARYDPGHERFHAVAPAGVACATCHPEGGDDGTIWPFSQVGPRRTQSISGGILDTQPLHWEGDRADMFELMADTFIERMGGEALSVPMADAMAAFVDSLPADVPLPVEDPMQVEAGRLAFERRGCSECHAGPRFTDNQSYDVGTGRRPFQVPSLRGVVFRAPYLHDGCAQTLAERFGPCGGDRHGDVAGLESPEIDALVAYMRSL